MPEPLTNIVEAGWATALEPVEGQIAAMGDFLRQQIASGKKYLPAGENVLRAFKQPFDDIKVLIVGQDPYPTPGHPVGLSFSVDPKVTRLPGSLVNIFREYSQDLGYPTPATGDLSPWAERGVLLLNKPVVRRLRILRITPVQQGKPAAAAPERSASRLEAAVNLPLGEYALWPIRAGRCSIYSPGAWILGGWHGLMAPRRRGNFPRLTRDCPGAA